VSNAIFIGSLYLAIVVALIVGGSSALLGVSAMTTVIRTALAFATFAFLGWVLEVSLRNTTDQQFGSDEDGDQRGTTVDVVLPSTEKD